MGASQGNFDLLRNEVRHALVQGMAETIHRGSWGYGNQLKARERTGESGAEMRAYTSSTPFLPLFPTMRGFAKLSEVSIHGSWVPDSNPRAK